MGGPILEPPIKLLLTEYFSNNINNNSWVHLVYSQVGDTLFTYSNGLLDEVTFNSISLNLDSTLSIELYQLKNLPHYFSNNLF